LLQKGKKTNKVLRSDFSSFVMRAGQEAAGGLFPTRIHHWLGIAVLASAYLLAGVAGLSVQTTYQGITPIWPASGIAFASLFLFGVRLWPAIITAMLGLAVYTDIPLYVALAAGAGSVLEAVIPVSILRRKGFDGNLNRLNGVLQFVLYAVILGPVFSATTGSLAMAAHHSLDLASVGRMWAFWWLGNSIGLLVMGSVILIWSTAPKEQTSQDITGKALTAILTVSISFTSVAIHPASLSTLTLFLLLPLIITAAMRYSMRWVSLLYLGAFISFLVAGALYVPDNLHVAEIDGVYLNIAFMVVFAFIGLFASAARIEQIDKHILEIQATTDQLTGMLNRHAFLDQLNATVQMLRREDDRHSLLYLDLDGLKNVNDSAGHAAGDKLLQTITGIIRRIIRSQDIAGRLGGDEFAILLRNCDISDALGITEKIRQAVRRYAISIDERRYSVTASIGIVDIDRSCHDVPRLLESVDQACYASKRAGGDRFTLTEVMQSPGKDFQPPPQSAPFS
jgi:diguanylate cyclase (GGDEF)-like protein